MTAPEWQGWVGREGEIVPGPYPVSAAAIGYLAEALDDERLARHVATAPTVTAPRSFVTISSRVPNWRPAGAPGPGTFMQAMLVPLPATSAVNLSVDQRYFAPLREGDRVSSRSTIRSIQPKTTRLGDGFIIVEEIEHRTRDALIATTLNTVLRFSPKSQAPAERKAPAEVASPEPESDFPPVRVPITMTRLTCGAAAVRDFSPLHHDVDLARAVGHPTAFLSYSHQLAIAVSAIGRWFEGDAALRRLRLDLKLPVYLGKTLTCTAVEQPSAPGSERQRTLAIRLSTEDGTCTTGVAELDMEIDRR
ncbi:MAG TPA: MaoC family dehydratase N-terminal domain-containing protein [Ramlibacter sp.]|nr:MaoC family dehydratase N-terminal domain-containing protein [Ramlibacter sp.]